MHPEKAKTGVPELLGPVFELGVPKLLLLALELRLVVLGIQGLLLVAPELEPPALTMLL